MQETTSDRWQFVLVGAFLAVIAVGVYFAQRQTPIQSNRAPVSVARNASHETRKSLVDSTAARKKTKEKQADTPRKTQAKSVPQSNDQALQGECGEANRKRHPLGSSQAPTPQLVNAIRLVDTERESAVAALEPLKGTPIADAYLGYLLILSNHTTESAEALSRVRFALPEPLCRLSLPDPTPRAGDNPIRVSLRTLRLALEEQLRADSPPLLACSMFRTHPLDSTIAFSVMWGTARDDLGKRMKQHCVNELLLRVSPKLTPHILRAEEVLCDALQKVEPIPLEPMYRSIYTAACDLLRDIILAPELTILNEDRDSTKILGELVRNAPQLANRIKTYEITLEQHAPYLGKGLCAVGSSRNQEDSLENCIRRAKQTANEALTSWVSSVQTSPSQATDAD